MATCNVNELLENGKCFACLTPGQLDIIIAQLMCEIVVAGGGGGGGGVTCGDYAGGEPTFTPSTACAVAIDTSNGQIWWYYNGGWN